ncbi:VPS10 domain-containing protein [Aquimarina sp. 2201CG5-10]|uniref:VPS10 domain-containing protein n=1 Tax=Aquimarina callyspongiae TaxID=3098150 RepID=UPI002AB5C779|nr:T9SS type A sorting domain-containing protein [Aquimarina sp. 2201CG5-10]MDY8138142.1 T9SS type A sorting domain-containing protein [Aquimarina sp. 2201CG5-10]
MKNKVPVILLKGALITLPFVILTFLFLIKEQAIPTTNTSEEIPGDYMFIQRAYPSGKLKRGAHKKAIQWKKSRLATKNSGIPGIWEFVGPVNVGGRITDIEIPSSQTTTAYVGAASGGIFKTIDDGTTWNPIFDDQDMLSIGDIEISKTDNNLIYVGTGEPNAGGNSLAYDGDGIYKSNDGGITWVSKGLTNVGSIGKVIIDPTDDQTVFVGAMGSLFEGNANKGVYRTTDGGDTWQQVLFIGNNTGVIDMAIHPTNRNIIYAVTWERIRTLEFRDYGGVTSGIHRSIDGGTTWTELTTGLPGTTVEKGRISIDISQSNPDILYALYTDNTGNLNGTYKTIDGGDNWTQVNHDQLTNVGFHWWFGGIHIDPTDPDVLYNVGFNVERSIDGGNNWSQVFVNVHVDQHAMAFKSNNSLELLLGNDGGLFESSNRGDSYTKNLKLPITQFYRFHVDAQNDNRIYGGTQDNGTIRTTTGSDNDWSRILGGDGFQSLVDPTNSSVIYAQSQFGNLAKSSNDATFFVSSTNGIPPTNSPENFRNWDVPIAFDPNDSNTLFFGARKLYKTTDAAANWSAISPDLSTTPDFVQFFYGTITSVSVSPIDSNVIYVGTDDGNVWITENGGTNWTKISDSLPVRWVTKVQASRSDINDVYVTFSGYRYADYDGHVYKSDNKGTSWTDLSTGLPDIPVSDIEIDEFNNLFIATDIGVMASVDDGVNWEVFGTNLPSVVVTDLVIHEGTKYLYAATYGRSSYKMDISSNILSVEDVKPNNISVEVYPNPTENTFSIQGMNKRINSIDVYTVNGQLVETFNGDHLHQKEINIEKLSRGVYLIRVNSDVGIYTTKIIKK